MYDLIVIGFPDAKTAEAARDELFALPTEEIFRVSCRRGHARRKGRDQT